MESARDLLFVLGSSSLWLTGSGLVLWLCLRSRLRLSPGTCAAASMLVVLQGWIWIGIPVQLNLAWLPAKPVEVFAEKAAPSDAVPAVAAQMSGEGPVFELPLAPDTRSMAHSEPQAGSPSVASWRPDVRQLAAGAGAIWFAGIVVLLWRSIRGFVALSRLVQALPEAPWEWQSELSAECCELKIAKPPVLKIGAVAAPLLVQTWQGACIVVPTCLWQLFNADERRSILLHELAHYQRGDVWRQLAMRLLILPHWFNPVAWWAARQFEAASEAACDAVACGGDVVAAISYSKVLLALNEMILNETFVEKRLGICQAQALAISGGSLTERVRHILHPDSQKESHMSRFLILSAMLALAGLATIRIQAADEAAAAKNDGGQSESAPGVVLKRRTITEEYERVEPAKAANESLLENGGFEEAQSNSDDPEAWFATRWPKTPGHYLMGASKSVAHGGQRSVFVEIAESHPETPVHYNWTALAKGWKVGETYELSGWVKTENAKSPAFIMAQFWSGEGSDAKMIGGATTQMVYPVKGTTDWTRVSTRMRVPQGTSAVRIRAGLSSQDNPGAKAWLDDVSLVAVVRSANKSNENKSSAAPGGSLIFNGSFEEPQGGSGDPEDWFGTRVPDTAGHFQLSSSSVAHSGKRSAVVEIGENHPDRQIAYNWTTVAEGWKVGETYELSGWIKTENAKHPAFVMAQFWTEEGKGGKMLGGASARLTDPGKGTDEWTRVNTRLKVPEGTGVVRIRAGLTSQDNLGAKAWLDDISLVKVAAN